MFMEKAAQYAILIEQDAMATQALRQAEEFFELSYRNETDMCKKAKMMSILVNAQLSAQYANTQLEKFIIENGIGGSY